MVIMITFSFCIEELALFAVALLFVVRKCVLRVSTDRLALPIENVWNCAACQGNEGQEGTSPPVIQPIIHLLREQDNAGTPHRPKEGLGCKGRGSLVLVGIHCSNIST